MQTNETKGMLLGFIGVLMFSLLSLGKRAKTK